VPLLIEHGADVNAKSHSGNTALHYAIDYGHMAVVSVLVAQGADVRAKNNEGITAELYASRSNSHDIVQLLSSSSQLALRQGVSRVPPRRRALPRPRPKQTWLEERLAFYGLPPLRGTKKPVKTLLLLEKASGTCSQVPSASPSYDAHLHIHDVCVESSPPSPRNAPLRMEDSAGGRTAAGASGPTMVPAHAVMPVEEWEDGDDHSA
jgi:hypothetical protein